MAFGSSKDDDGIISDINITPMVDIILVLLVIFMVTANFLKKESININLPKVAAADPNIKESKQVAITKEGKYFLEGRSVSESGLVDEISREVKYRPNMRVTLSADESLSYGSVSRVMGLLRKCGVTRMALSVKK
ncbi:MAG TPA: biopolymer transporter ExbD [Spirochaetota bacterium]|jgi:biopolymer transport protein ExbD|nr:biopolymer transporter ExbD [Spirochaetota bacterium]OQA97131.1 MAG: Biopolymer transport protein ExbD [Spirochaetes bacterium ADurb.Bin218]HOK03069.1 biopolymer transporter ExbD [Spirochaetota bacterium]HOK93306.1 biopolymer transporter ExbD [Spirochaetota bacterium]HON16518.1 biopolymer transporter ExbD [Spirochaetota bacterium]